MTQGPEQLPDNRTDSEPTAPENNPRLEYPGRPRLLDATFAHNEGIVTYTDSGLAIVKSELSGLPGETEITPDKQYPCVWSHLTDLQSALSASANSPRLPDETTLRDNFDHEFAFYLEKAQAAMAVTNREADYGTYMFDPQTHEIYQILPEEWHRLMLVASNSKLLKSPDDSLPWWEIRQLFENVRIGVVGLSVGGNVLEGIMRDICPRMVRVSDNDIVQGQNLNRLNRGKISHTVSPRSARTDLFNPFDQPRPAKSAVVAREFNLRDPYVQIEVYPEGINERNVAEFVQGLDIIFEEADNPNVKIWLVRQEALRQGKTVIMISDFAQSPSVQYVDYRESKSIVPGLTDAELKVRYDRAMVGTMRQRWEFFAMIAGSRFFDTSFGDYVDGTGEHPVASVPQLGGTALDSGYLASVYVAAKLLGYTLPEIQTFSPPGLIYQRPRV